MSSLTGISLYIGHGVNVQSTTDRKLTEKDHVELYARYLFKKYHPDKDWWNNMLEQERMVWRDVALQHWPIVKDLWLERSNV